MKKHVQLLLIILISFLSINSIKAQTFVPAYVDFARSATTTPIFKAGESVKITFTLKQSILPKDRTTVEYGIVREIVDGSITSFEPIQILGTQKSANAAGEQSIDVEIPNILDTYATSTYVFYVKSTVDNDP